MKTRTIVTLIAFLLMGTSINAQFWKKVKDRAKEAAEETVLNKTAEKAAEKTDKTMEKIFDMDFGKNQSKIDPAILQNTYEYNWKYTLQMQHKKGNMNMSYYLRDGATDFGNKLEMDDTTQAMDGMFMIMDQAAGVTAILMERNGKKFGQVMGSPLDDIIDLQEQEEENQIDDYEFKEIGTKEILGYKCQGFQMENEDVLMTMYLAFDTPVSFNQIYAGQNSQRLPKGFDPKWLDKIGDNSLMMELNMVNKNKAKQNVKMTCVALEEESIYINMSEYEFPQLQMQEQIED